VGVRPIAISPDGRLLAAGHFDGSLTLWDIALRTSRATLKLHDHVILGVSFAPDGRTLATSSIDKTAKLWRLHE
jgi:WD40 repeat protein